MSQIDIYCPHCNQKLGMNREKFYESLGKKTACPTCHKSMTLSQDLFACWREPPKQEKQKSGTPRKEPPHVQPQYQQEDTRTNPQPQPKRQQKDTRSGSKFCTKCGHPLGGGNFCGDCGHPFEGSSQKHKQGNEKWKKSEDTVSNAGNAIVAFLWKYKFYCIAAVILLFWMQFVAEEQRSEARVRAARNRFEDAMHKSKYENARAREKIYGYSTEPAQPVYIVP